MKISGIDNLDVGMSNIEIEGKVTYVKAPRHIEGDNDKGHYDFYSQFIVIDDGTGKIGCNVSIEKEAHCLKKDIVARVKGKLEEYKDKNSEVRKSLKGKLIAISQGNKITDVQQEVAEEYFDEKAKEEKTALVTKPMAKVDNKVWEEKDLRIARECAIKAVTELACAKIMKSKDFFNFANTIVKYIYNGQTDKPKTKAKPKPATKGEKLALARHIAEGKKGKLEVKDKDAPFPGEITKKELEEIENAVNEKEEPGSSYNNPIPFKGKAKATD